MISTVSWYKTDTCNMYSNLTKRACITKQVKLSLALLGLSGLIEPNIGCPGSPVSWPAICCIWDYLSINKCVHVRPVNEIRWNSDIFDYSNRNFCNESRNYLLKTLLSMTGSCRNDHLVFPVNWLVGGLVVDRLWSNPLLQSSLAVLNKLP